MRRIAPGVLGQPIPALQPLSGEEPTIVIVVVVMATLESLNELPDQTDWWLGNLHARGSTPFVDGGWGHAATVHTGAWCC